MAALLAAACHGNLGRSAAAPAPTASDSIVLERTPCFGACPTYVLTIVGTGVTTFDGTGRLRGRYGADTLAPAAVVALFARIDSTNVWELADYYTPDHHDECGRYATDAPSAVLTIERGTRRKRIDHYYGCSAAPAVLRDLEHAIDSVARTDRWTAAASDLEPKPPR